MLTCSYQLPYPMAPVTTDIDWWVHRIVNLLVTRHSQHIIRMAS